MDDLPGHLLDKVLFGMDQRSLAMMCCTNRSLQSHIHDPCFESEYSSRIRSGLLCISSFGSSYLCYNSYNSQGSSDTLRKSHILGSCSGLLLLFIGSHLCVANPLTKKFRFFNLCTYMRFTGVDCGKKKSNIGFAVNKIDRTFKIVHMIDLGNSYETRYRFRINTGNSWRRLRTTVTCDSSDLMKTPVYLDGSLHWLRNDGSIIALNLETELARLVPIKFPQGSSSKTLFAAGDDRLIFISATEEVIKFYALENILSDPKWVLVMQIRNGVMDVKRLAYWNVEAYDGKCLVLREDRKKEQEGLEYCYDRLVHVYDLSASKWLVMGSVPPWSDANRDVFQFTPSPSSVVGLDEILACDDKRISSISSIMALIDGSSSEKVEQQLRKRSAEHNLLHEQSTNKKKSILV